MQDKEIRADAKLKNLSADVLDELWRLRNPEEDGEKLTLEAVLVHIKNEYGMEVSLSTISEFYKWLRFKRRMDSGKLRAEQVMEQMIKDPSMTLESIHDAAQYAFTHATLDEDDPKTYIALAKLRLEAAKVKNDERKIQLLEAKAARLDKAESDIAAIRENAGMSEEDQRKAILDKVDEIFGIKK
jgi:hypothetical protein